MLKSYKYELIPTDAQKEYFAKIFGSCRFIYNLSLEARRIKMKSLEGALNLLRGFSLKVIAEAEDSEVFKEAIIHHLEIAESREKQIEGMIDEMIKRYSNSQQKGHVKEYGVLFNRYENRIEALTELKNKIGNQNDKNI